MAHKNVERLIKAGLLDADQVAGFNDDQRKAIESLSQTEVEGLIGAKKKLGFSSSLHDLDGFVL